MGFAFSFFTGSAELMFVAAIIAAAVYLPVFLLQRRRNKNLPILRHAANYALCGYLLLLVYAVFLYGKYSLQGTTQGRHLTGGVPPVRFSM